jgi:hypothetical protein
MLDAWIHCVMGNGFKGILIKDVFDSVVQRICLEIDQVV